MGQVRFQIGVPRAGSAARVAEGTEPLARMPLPQAGAAARDTEQRKKLEGETGAAKPVIALRGTGGRVVSMEEMIAASRPAGAAPMVWQPATPATGLAPAAQEATHVKGTIARHIHENATEPAAVAVSITSAPSSVTVAGYPLPTSGGAVSQSAPSMEGSGSPGLPRFAADRVKALVRSLFSREQ